MSNDKIGFDCCQILMRCNTTGELDEAIRIINNMYPKLHEHLEIMEQIDDKIISGGMDRFCFVVGPGGKRL